MNNDRQLTISTANSRKSTFWPQAKIYWSELVQKLSTPIRSSETLQEYLKMPKSQQDKLKDVGGFVAGGLLKGRRKANNVTGRDVITLDLDNVPSGATDDILKLLNGLGGAFAVYSTRKHEVYRPRLRILFPLDRTVTAEEYEAIARKLGEFIGISLCDPSTFEPSRLMYWPSCCSDSEYVFTYADKPFVSADGILDMYPDWHDINEWPIVEGECKYKTSAKKQGDPVAKSGVVGAFCKVYNIYDAIEKYIPDTYTFYDDGRLTYTKGSTTGGAVIYENGNFLYSHHATDPAGGNLCNAFDLIRLHLYGEKDEEVKQGCPINKYPSYTAMTQLALSDPNVVAVLNKERYEKATEEFDKPLTAAKSADWAKELKLMQNGTYAKTTDNLIKILCNDPLLKDKLAFDEFGNRILALGPLPWDASKERRRWTDVDDAGIRHYFEKVYQITGKERVYDAVTLVAYRNIINEVKEYLNSLKWDGKERLDSMLIEYLGAENNIYVRAVTRKAFTAAVTRALVPGTKFDYMTILSGPQGIGKSTLLRFMGGKWYSDSLLTFEGKEAYELIQGTWINELGELQGLTKSETNAVKLFLSKSEDIYRESYGRRTVTFPRRCIFFGTTNDSEFLKDRTGNRRFWPVDCYITKPIKNIFTQLVFEVDQLWAEAYYRMQQGEELYLKGEIEEISREVQESHRESNAKEGITKEFIERPVPVDWEKRDILSRRLYWSADFGREKCETMERDKICAAEIYCECFNSELKYMKRREAMEINSILNSMEGWSRCKTSMRMGPYGVQKGFIKGPKKLVTLL